MKDISSDTTMNASITFSKYHDVSRPCDMCPNCLSGVDFIRIALGNFASSKVSLTLDASRARADSNTDPEHDGTIAHSKQPLAMNGSACQHTFKKSTLEQALDGFKLPDSDSEFEDRLRKPTDELLSFWRGLWERKLNAKEFCILMSWCAECAVKTCARFALRSGNSRTARCLLECQ